MIRLMKRIRFRFLTENRLSRYLLYTSGEILLVAIAQNRAAIMLVTGGAMK